MVVALLAMGSAVFALLQRQQAMKAKKLAEQRLQDAEEQSAAVTSMLGKMRESDSVAYITEEDMVLIPAGEFQMGSNDGHEDERPVHTVDLDAFYMDKYEVTNAQYKKFIDATGYPAPRYWSDSRYNASNQPVVGVTWYDAKAYCKWLSEKEGKTYRLPTEAEWEKAARGGLVGKKYPWGDILTHDYANYKGTGGRDKWDGTSPVDSFLPNGYGLYDMAGNVWYWCADWYGENYYSSSPKYNPKGPNSGRGRVLRGGSWGDPESYLRVSIRIYYAQTDLNNIGFRCVSQNSNVTP
jgi:sulfatase modifying factor 1